MVCMVGHYENCHPGLIYALVVVTEVISIFIRLSNLGCHLCKVYTLQRNINAESFLIGAVTAGGCCPPRDMTWVVCYGQKNMVLLDGLLKFVIARRGCQMNASNRCGLRSLLECAL